MCGFLTTAPPPFFVYEEPTLNHAWLAGCAGFATLRQSVQECNTAEVGAYKALRHHPSRVVSPQHAMIFYVPVFE